MECVEYGGVCEGGECVECVDYWECVRVEKMSIICAMIDCFG